MPRFVDAVVTSPPYMNELDYIRDNRLRLWLIDRRLPTHRDTRTRDREGHFRMLMRDTLIHALEHLRPAGTVVLVVGDVTRGGHHTDAATLIEQTLSDHPTLGALRLYDRYSDRIPDVRRSRRDLRGTKTETVLVYKSLIR